MARPKGYAEWNPSDETRLLLSDVKAVLVEYEDHLPLTVRQIFYRLVGQYGFEKTEKAYARLCEHLVRARRARMIPFEQIRDDGTIEYEPQLWTDVPDWWRTVKNTLKNSRRDRLQDQDVRIELWCEAAGMVPQLARVAFPYAVSVYSTGGFSSVTVTHEIAKRAMEYDRPTVFLHVGDFDPSGESIFEAMSQDAWKFVVQERYWDLLDSGHDEESAKAIVTAAEDGERNGAWLIPERVALTGEQVEEYDLPTAPPKKTDTRSRSWTGETCQCEAMPPDVLASVVREAIEQQIDSNRYVAQRHLEDADRKRITADIEAGMEER